MTGATGWAAVPDVIVRTTGFPLDLLAPLLDDGLAAVATRHGEAQHRLERLRAGAPRFARPTRRAISRLRNGRRLDTDEVGDTGWVQRWNRAVDAVEEASSEVDTALAEHERRASQALSAARADPRLRAAIASTAPGVLRDLDRDPLPARSRRQLAGFLQRFCAKNETTAFFGPINYGRCDPDAPDELSLRWSGPGTVAARRVFAAHWLVESLVDALAHDEAITPWLVPDAVPLTPELAARLPGALRRIHALADGRTPLHRLAATLGDETGRTLRAARAGFRAGVLDHQLRPPDGVPDALADLVTRLAAVPAGRAVELGRRLDALLVLAQRYGGGAEQRVEVTRRFAEGVEALVPPPLRRRPAGGFYSDRLPLREEAAGDLDLCIAGRHARALLDDLGPLLDALSGHAVRARAAARHRVAAALGEGRHGFLEAVQRAGGLPTADDPLLAATLEEERAGAPPGQAVDVTAALAGLPSAPCEGAVCSVDLMVAARDLEAWRAGEVEVVVGDVHDTALLTAWGLQFHPRAAVVAARTAGAVRTAAADLVLVRVVSRRRSGLPAPEPPGLVLEFRGRTAQPRAWRARAEALVVCVEGDEARLVDTMLEREVTLHNGELEGLVQQAFGLPRLRALPPSTARRAPRLVCRRVVAQRAHGRLLAGEVEALLATRSHRALVEWAAGVWHALGLPATAVASVAGERKPVVVHAASPLLLGNLRRLVGAGSCVTFSEFLPAPDACWLHDGPRRHTSEIRTVVVRAGSP